MQVQRINLGDELVISAIDEEDLREKLLDVIPVGSFSFAVNAEKLIRLEHDELLCKAMRASQFRYIDGVAAKWCVPKGLAPQTLLQKIDLPSMVIDKSHRSRQSLAVVGATESELASACNALHSIGVHVDNYLHGYHSDDEILSFLQSSKTQFTLLGVGSPRQERLAHMACNHGLSTRVIPCGGAIRLLGGAVTRAPKWLQQGGLETLYRLLLEPSRMKRYMKLGKVIPIIKRRRACASRIKLSTP